MWIRSFFSLTNFLSHVLSELLWRHGFLASGFFSFFLAHREKKPSESSVTLLWTVVHRSRVNKFVSSKKVQKRSKEKKVWKIKIIIFIVTFRSHLKLTSLCFFVQKTKTRSNYRLIFFANSHAIIRTIFFCRGTFVIILSYLWFFLRKF